MAISTIVLLGAIAGFTIFFGLPLARVKTLSTSLKGFLAMLAAGILLYLLVDVTAKMLEPIGESFTSVSKKPGALETGLLQSGLLVLGVAVGLVGIVYLTRSLRKKGPDKGSKTGPQVAVYELDPKALSLIIATGIGAHNLSEGLAIGQSAASGALQLALILIIGFGLHNMTEGFGIAGPITGKSVSWKFIGLLGLVGGGPTFLGTILGISFHSTELFIFCLAFAAGAIVNVVMELLSSTRRYSRETVVWGLFVGFLLGLGTDLILTVAGT